MKIDLFNVDEFIDVNNLHEITSPILFQRGDIPHPNGLISNEIFGVTTKSRRETYAFINLHGYFFHPHVYKAIRRMFRNIDKIVNGEQYYVLDENGRLKLDENGETGIEFIYNNWEKINWSLEGEDKNNGLGMRNERVALLKNNKKNEIFIHYQIVIPAFYRDITTGSSSNGGETDDINNMYAKLIRLATLIKNQDMFDFQFHSTNYTIQTTIVAIYDYFKHKLEKKKGLIRKYLMGKNVDYCTRTVITAPTYHADRPEDLFTDFSHAGIPIAQVCSLAYPFVLHWIKDFFEREVIDSQHAKILYNPATDQVEKVVKIVNPESYFSDKYIKKIIDTFIKDPESRFTKIEVPTDGTQKMYLTFTGKRMDSSNTSEIAATVNRPMTWTDLLYLACEEVVRDKHTLITRYPINDEFGLFVARIRVLSTSKTIPLMVNGYLYKWYPYVDPNESPSEVAKKFIDSVQFSNSYLPGIEGDYDGDQTTVKIIYTQEANEECARVINRKSHFINASGSNIRKVGKEALQTFYVLTKDPFGKYKELTNEEKKYFLGLKKEDLTFSNFVNWFGDTVDLRDDDRTKKQTSSKFNVSDTLTISPNEYSLVHGTTPIKTTLGRLIFNKVLVESLGFGGLFEFQNKVFTAKAYGGFDATVANALKDDRISVEQMREYIDTRDWFGLQVHSIITSSFTPGVVNLPPEIQEMKKKLMEENKEAIKAGDARVIEEIEKKLIAATKKALDGDIGMDLYMSGARGSVDNHLKNIMLTRGAVQNPVTKEYDIIENSLMDGLAKKDIGTHSNMIVSGAYPKAVGTQVSGYLSKELLAAFQGEVLAEKDSDCGSLRCIHVKLTDGNYKDFMYRYVKTPKGLVMLTADNKSQFVGKEVEMRSPMYCIGAGKEKCLCNKCAGDYYYILGKPNIGLATGKCGTTITQLNLQKFHQNLVKTQQIDVNDMLI